MNPVTRAINLVGLKRLAEELGVTYQAVRKWERSRVPAERCAAIQRATGNQVMRHDLRPDLFEPKAGDAAAKDAA